MARILHHGGGDAVPLHRRIMRDVLAARRAGDPVFAGDGLPPVRALCARFQTSRVTITKMIAELRQDGHVHAVRRRGVFWGVTSSPYVYRTIGVLFPAGIPVSPNRTPTYFEIFNSMRQAAERRGLALKLLPAGVVRDRGLLRQAGCDGVVAHGQDPAIMDFVRACRELNLPCLLLNRPAPDDTLNFIERDSVANIADMTRFLLARGHTRIGLVGFKSRAWYRRMAFIGYERAMRAAGRFNTAWIFRLAGAPMSGAASDFQHLAEFARGCTALLITTAVEGFLQAAVRALLNAGIAIPKDCSIITTATRPDVVVDGIRLANACITTGRMGVAAIIGLADLIEGKKRPPVHVFFPTRIHAGASIADLNEAGVKKT